MVYPQNTRGHMYEFRSINALLVGIQGVPAKSLLRTTIFITSLSLFIIRLVSQSTTGPTD